MSIRTRLSSALDAILGEPLDLTALKTDTHHLATIRRTLDLMGQPASAEGAIAARETDAALTAEDRARFVAVAEQWREDRTAICPDCGPVAFCDEDRCCWTCGTDLIVVVDAHSGEMLDEWRVRAAEVEEERDMLLDERDTLRAELDAAKPRVRAVVPVPPERLLAVLRAVDGSDFAPTAVQVADRMTLLDIPAFNGCGASRIAEVIRQAVTDGYLSTDRQRGGFLDITEKGRDALDSALGGVGVAS